MEEGLNLAAILPIRRPTARRGWRVSAIQGAAHEWLAGRVARQEIRQRTFVAQRDRLRLFVTYVGPSRDVSSVTRRDVERFLAEAGPRVSTGTLRQMVTVVRMFFAWCATEGLVRRNPCAGLRMPKKPRSLPRGLPDAAVERVLAAAADARTLLILSLMVREGCRACEVGRLDVADVDRRAGTVRLVGKGGHERIVPLSPQTAVVIDAYVASERGRSAGRLVRSRHPGPFSPADGLAARSVAHLAAVAFKAAGVAESGHSLRHSAAYGLIEAGANVRQLQEFLGHVSLATTQVYMRRAEVEELRPFVGKKQYEEAGCPVREEER